MDYKKLGLRVGLEIHQQLNTKHKLFCNCPIKKSSEFPVEIKRKLRAVAGELGEFDPAALYEFLRRREFIYRMNSESSCLVETDEEPPGLLNREALNTAVQVCKLLNCLTADEVHVMRKTVIDGSSVSGFQRTALIGYNGCLKAGFGMIGIQTICLEEDAAPALKKEDGIVEYRLDRLGIPLVEIATSSDIDSPEHAREVAEKLGLILRSVNVMRGIGTIRQDVNISIKQGARVEIKGFQELGKIASLISNEVARQVALLEIKDELSRRGKKESKTMDATEAFRNTKCNFIRKIINQKGRVSAVMLPNFAGLLKKQVGDRTFGRELSAYAEAYGYGIIHSDEDLEKYQLSWEFERLRQELHAGDRDLILIVAGRSPEKAVQAVLDRAGHCYTGVPEETRMADGSGSRYTRPLPGSERMYPETDVPPVRLDRKYLRAVVVPKTLLERERELEKSLPKELASQIIRSRYYPLFDEFTKRFKIDHVLIANTLLSTVKDLKRRGLAVEKISKGDLEYIFSLLEKRIIAEDSLPDALIMVAEDKRSEIETRLKLISDAELEKVVSDIVKKNPGRNESALMGLIMSRVRGRASGEAVIKLLRKKAKF